MPPVFAPLYNVRDNACWPTLLPRQTIPSTAASRAATQASKVGLGVVKAACRVLTSGRVLDLAWSPDVPAWCLSYRGDSAAVRFSGTPTTWQVGHAKSYHLAVATIVDALLLGKELPTATEFRERWFQLIARLTVLAGPPPYTDWRLAQCAQDQEATAAMMAATDACYFYAKSRAATDGLQVIEDVLLADSVATDLTAIALLWTPDIPEVVPPPATDRPRRRLFTQDDFA